MSEIKEEHIKREALIDFIGGTVGYRLKSGAGIKQPLIRAIGFKKTIVPKVVDATAGLGRDAFLMASIGMDVTLIERSDIIHAQLLDAMKRAKAEGGIYAEIISRMTLIHGNSIVLLPDLASDVILVDPMHPPRDKTALVKKKMRNLRDIVGSDEDQVELMQVALDCAKKRVVLKWPMRAKSMQGIREPSHQILGKTTRYDVFMV